MEVLYTKLYTKYTKLKKEKESEFDKLNHDQEVKFLNFTAAADEMIQYLKKENDKLNGQVDELKSELASIRSSSDEQHIHYKKLLMEENQKNKELSEEIARIQRLEHNQCSNCAMPEDTGRIQENSHDDTPYEETSGKSVRNLMKKRKSLLSTEGIGIATPLVDRIADRSFNGDKGSGHRSSIPKPFCCQKMTFNSGGDVTDSSSVSCVFQYLVEFVVGMKVSPLTQSNELCVLAHHQSSGYSFSLTWIRNSRGEVELLYRVLSLGTFERVAPQWMKETLMFSTTMCSVFFARVSRVINS